jgi:hypothetical protein
MPRNGKVNQAEVVEIPYILLNTPRLFSNLVPNDIATRPAEVLATRSPLDLPRSIGGPVEPHLILPWNEVQMPRADRGMP